MKPPSTPPTAPLPFDGLDLSAEAVQARFADAARRGNSAWLWPDVTRQDWRSALLWIEGRTSGVLSSGDVFRKTPDDGSEVSPEAFTVAAYTSGMGPLLGYWIARGAIQASPPIAAIADLHLRHNRVRMERLLGVLDDIGADFARHGIPIVPLKGIHTARRYFPEPGCRPLSDLDLFVPAAAFDDAVGRMKVLGFELRAEQWRPRRSEWRTADGAGAPRSLRLTHAEDPWSIDLHASLDRNFGGVATVRFDTAAAIDGTAVDPEWVYSGHESPRLGGPGSQASAGGPPGSPVGGGLPQPMLTLLLATHASEGLLSLSLLRLTELALVIRADASAGRLDWGDLMVLAREVGATRFAFPAFELCEKLVPGTVPAHVLDAFRQAATPAMRRVVASLSPATAQRLDQPLSLEERYMWCANLGERFRRLAYTAWPASAGRSVDRLAEIYRLRMWRLLRGTIER